jgi:DNA-binding beta-propeller fold protein YncE
MRTAIARALGTCATLVALGALAPPALAGPSDPLFVATPVLHANRPPEPPPFGYLSGPCGLALAPGSLYLSDYYHQAIDLFNLFSGGFMSQPLEESSPSPTHTGPLDDPCGLALDSAGDLFLNNYHRNVVRFPTPLSPADNSAIAGEPVEQTHPTGVAVDPASNRVYVDQGSYVSVFDSSGAPIEEAGQPVHIGKGTLGDGYGIAVSAYPPTAGLLYVPDVGTNTVKVYDPAAADKSTPVATIDGHELPSGSFTSLVDSAIAVDPTSGRVYVADDLQPAYAERPQALIEAFSPAEAYLGHLKYLITDARPPGLATDGLGDVYVTSGNTVEASIYAYGPNAATIQAPICTVSLSCPPGTVEGTAPGGGSAASPSEPAKASAGEVSQATTSSSQLAQKGNLRAKLNGALSPKRLPRRGDAPVAVSVGWVLSTTDGSPSPKLSSLEIEINRHGRFSFDGLPTCSPSSIQPASTQRALANCRGALVGQGSFEAEVALRGQEAYESKGRLLLFNGKAKAGHVLYGHIYTAYPFATSFLIPFELKERRSGTYGTELDAKLPASLRRWGNLTGVQMTISRRYSFQGKKRSFVSAACPAPKGFDKSPFQLARASFSFAGGVKLGSILHEVCRVRG